MAPVKDVYLLLLSIVAMREVFEKYMDKLHRFDLIKQTEIELK